MRLFPVQAVESVIVLSLVVLAAGRTAAQAIVLPRHASEVAEILQSPPAPGGLVAVRRTSLTVGVSTLRYCTPLVVPFIRNSIFGSKSRTVPPRQMRNAHPTS